MTTRVGVQRTDNRYRGSPEWYTPAWLMARIRAFLGPDFYDPCPASYGQPAVNGLAVRWHGHVYCNPPYGAAIGPWVRKALTERCSEVILLVPGYTETRWFAPLYGHTLCFLAGRLAFERVGGSVNKSPYGSVLVYRGRRYRQFAEAFADLGPVVRTYRPRRAAQPTLLEVPA